MHQGTDKIKGIMVKDDIPEHILLSRENFREYDVPEQIRLSRKSFKKLKRLQKLIISENIFYGDHVDYLSNESIFPI